jgi:hypothetical protein
VLGCNGWADPRRITDTIDELASGRLQCWNNLDGRGTVADYDDSLAVPVNCLISVWTFNILSSEEVGE